jgi:hypothetical protein
LMLMETFLRKNGNGNKEQPLEEEVCILSFLTLFILLLFISNSIARPLAHSIVF